jgi:hypothetical protein
MAVVREDQVRRLILNEYADFCCSLIWIVTGEVTLFGGIISRFGYHGSEWLRPNHGLSPGKARAYDKA